jgi:hypothetical protein
VTCSSATNAANIAGGLVRDLNELAELKRAATQKRVELKRAVTQMHAMPLTETRH